MKYILVIALLAILSPSNGQSFVQWDCNPTSYNMPVQAPRNPSECDITASSQSVVPYVIRVGVYFNTINSYPDVISAYLGGKYYYYYHQIFNSRHSAELVLNKLQGEGRFCDAYVHQSPFNFVAYQADLIQ